MSVATVSYVYNDKWRERGISEAQAQRVRKKLEEENYRPSALGRQLRLGRTRTIGLVLADLTRPYNLGLLAAIERELAGADYFTLLGHSDVGRREAETVEVFLSRQIDGLLISPIPQQSGGEAVRRILDAGVPLVQMDNYLPDLPADFVVSDNRGGAASAVRHAVASGRRRIAYFGASRPGAALRDRYAGYAEAMEEAGLAPADAWVRRTFGAAGSVPALFEAMYAGEAPDALFVESFLYFDEAFRWLAGRGVRVPDDLMLIGFDPPEHALAGAREAAPALSAPIPFVEQDTAKMGRLAARRLLALLGEEKDLQPPGEYRVLVEPALRF